MEVDVFVNEFEKNVILQSQSALYFKADEKNATEVDSWAKPLLENSQSDL